jgi:hypothetical protein
LPDQIYSCTAFGVRVDIPAISRQQKPNGFGDIWLIFNQNNMPAHSQLFLPTHRLRR